MSGQKHRAKWAVGAVYTHNSSISELRRNGFGLPFMLPLLFLDVLVSSPVCFLSKENICSVSAYIITPIDFNVNRGFGCCRETTTVNGVFLKFCRITQIARLNLGIMTCFIYRLRYKYTFILLAIGYKSRFYDCLRTVILIQMQPFRVPFSIGGVRIPLVERLRLGRNESFDSLFHSATLHFIRNCCVFKRLKNFYCP